MVTGMLEKKETEEKEIKEKDTFESDFYWYTKRTIPKAARNKIRQMTAGKVVDEIEFSGIRRKLLEVSGAVFKPLFIENRRYLYKGEFTAPSIENDYLNSRNYVTEDGLAGFSLTGSGWLVSLYSNYTEKGFARAVKDHIIKSAYKLVCIVSEQEGSDGLVRMYEDLYGFRKYARTINDTVVMGEHYGDEFIQKFIKENGAPYHIFMIGKDAVGVTDSYPEFEDYFVAEKYVDDTVSRRN